MREITFITNGNYQKLNDTFEPLTGHLTITKSISPFISILKQCIQDNLMCGLDIETTSLNPFTGKILLISAGVENNIVVIDVTTIDISFLKNYTNIKYIGHNLEFDLSYLIAQKNIHIDNIYDTNLVERTLRRGITPPANDLDNVYQRRCGKQYPVPKTVRSTFNSKDKFTEEQIRYSASDIFTLFEIEKEHKKLIKKNNLSHYFNDIVFKTVYPLALAKIEGIGINKDEWLKIINFNKKAVYELELEMDKIIKELTKDNIKFVGGKFSNIRKKQDTQQLGFFGDSEPISNKNTYNINYSSSKEILSILREISPALPTKRSTTTYIVGPSLASDACEEFIYEYPESNIKEFLQLYTQYNEYQKLINSFGYKFIYPYIKNKSNKNVKGYYNELTNKVHTNYKLETTANGRLASGDSKVGYYNSQQLPKEKKYRVCFGLTKQEISNGYYITTLDYSGAELIILGALSGDKKLIELQKQDIHSYLGTEAYNSIIYYILNTFKPSRWYDELYDIFRVNKVYNSITKKEGDKVLPLTEEDKEKITNDRIQSIIENKSVIINKDDYKDLRDSFKNVVYGSSYGATSVKISKTLNVAKYYGELVLESMKTELNLAFKFLDESSKFGVKNGYIKFNDLTNNRCLFPSALESIYEGISISSQEIGNIERACKNYRISGTQADMIKHSIANVYDYTKENNIDCTLLLQVHDELVYKHKDKELGKEIAKIMTDTANLYLNNITEMSVDYDTLTTWTK